MKVQANLPPASPFTVEPHPQKPGLAIVRLLQNAVPAGDGWEYDEFTATVPTAEALAQDIEANHDFWLESVQCLDAGYIAEQAAAGELCEMAERVIDLEIENAFWEMGVNPHDV